MWGFVDWELAPGDSAREVRIWFAGKTVVLNILDMVFGQYLPAAHQAHVECIGKARVRSSNERRGVWLVGQSGKKVSLPEQYLSPVCSE